jgi:5-bromo-4-chloroindolyl phosphate hydrolysis protein
MRVEEPKKNSGPKIYILFALLLGIALGLAVGLIFHRPFFAVLAGVGGFVAGLVIFKPGKPKEPKEFENIDGVSREMHEAALTEGYEKLSKLRALAVKINDRGVKEKADRICGLTGQILDTIKNDPKDLKPARSFLNYYLDTAMRILSRYNELVLHQSPSKEVEEIIERVDRTLGTLEQAFEKQQERLLENDVLDLDTELTVLERTIEMEGLGTNLKERYHPKEQKHE